jgi:tRNA(fMet)-specific endonuclease VapC
LIYLLDTNAFSDFIREQPWMSSRLAALAPADRVMTCVIVMGEVNHGLERMPAGKRKQSLERKTSQFASHCPCEPVPVAAARHYARIKNGLQHAGLPLDENDLWIAATALALGARLVTRDAHFQRVPGLTTEDWSR